MAQSPTSNKPNLPPSRTRDQSRTGKPRGKKRWGRRILITLIVLVALLALSWWLFKGPITRAIVLGELEEATGAKVSATRVDLLPDGSLVLEEVVLRSPSVRGEGAEFLRAGRIQVLLEMQADGPSPKRVLIHEPTIRLSTDSESGVLNVMTLRPPDSSEPGDGLELPEIEISEGELEFGEHAGGVFTLLKAVPLTGEVLPLADVEGGYAIKLRTPAGGDESPDVPMVITGTIDTQGVQLKLDRVRLQEWVPQAVPTAYREIVESLGIRGDVASVTFAAGMDGGGIETAVSLDGVRMKLPLAQWMDSVDEDSAEAIDADVRTGTLRLSGGGLSASIVAVAAGVPMAIELDHRGTAMDSPFDLDIDIRSYALPRNPPWLKYVPEGVQWRIGSFNNPTGVVDAQIRIARERQGEQPMVRGDVQFRDAVAAFHAFPYEVQSLAGRASFDQRALRLIDIRGVSAQGASVVANGTISPPGPGARVVLDIDVEDVPLDDAMMKAMGPARRRMIDGLFHRPSYENLKAMGLLDNLGDGAAEFVLGGRSDVAVRIRRALGDDAEWERDITVTLDEAGLVTEAFPLPVIAQGVVIRLDGETARIDGGRFVPLTGGGEVDLSAEVDLNDSDDVSMVLNVDARQVRVDERVAYAVSNAGAVQRGAALMAEAVNGLRLDGLADCRATIKTGGRKSKPSEHPEYDVTVELNKVTASPQGGDGSLVLRDVVGSIAANSANAGVNLDARLDHDGHDAGTASISIEVDRQPGGEGDSAFAGIIRANELDLTAPVEQLVGIFAADTAGAMRDLRGRFHPTGKATLSVHLDGLGEGVNGATVEVSSTARAAIDSILGRVWVTQTDGVMRYVPELGGAEPGTGVVSMLDSRGEIGSGASAASVYRASGDWRLDQSSMREAGEGSIGSGDVVLTLTGAASEHELTRTVLDRALPDRLVDDMRRLDPEGPLDARLGLTWSPGGRLAASGDVFPGAIEISRGDRRVMIERQSGALQLRPSDRPTGGRLGAMEFAIGSAAPRATVRLDGGWDHDDQTGGSLGLNLDLTAPSGLDDDVLAMLPAPVADALIGASVASDEPMSVELTRLDVEWLTSGESTYALEGRATVRGASAQLGTGIADLDGRVVFSSRTKPGARNDVGFNVEVDADRLRIAGVRATDGRILLREGGAGEVLSVPQIGALVHGGRVAGVARLLEPAEATGADAGPEPPVRFEVDLRLAAVAFAEVLADWKVKTDQPIEESALPESEADAVLRDRSRGLMDGRIGLTGVVGDRSTVSGRGSVVIGGGRVLELPLVLRLIQVSNLEVPSNDPVDMAEATFVVQGERVRFEKLSVYTPSIEIAGHGTMRWTDQDMDLRFASRRVRRIPIVSEAIERFRDEIVQMRVSGVLAEPVVSLSQFSGTRKLLARLFGQSDNEAAQRLDRARRLAAERERIRRVDDQASKFLTTSDP